MNSDNKNMVRCSFCGIGDRDIKIECIVKGDDVAIRNICVETCRDVIGAKRLNICAFPKNKDGGG